MLEHILQTNKQQLLCSCWNQICLKLKTHNFCDMFVRKQVFNI